MIEGNVSEPLRSLLEFESEKLGLPIAYHRGDLKYAEIHGPFRPVVEIHVHTDRERESFCIPIGEDRIDVRAAVFSTPLTDAVGPVVDGMMIPVAYLKGRHVLVPFDLESLESDAPNAVNRIFDLIAEYALADAAEAITTYDWKDERERYARIKKLALDRCVISLRRDIDDNAYEVDRKTREVAELVRKNEELRDALEHLEHCKPRRVAENALREFVELRKLVPKPYTEIDFDESSLRAKTGRIEIDCDNGWYDLGRFEVRIEFDNDRLTINQLVADRIIDGYPHPHVDPHGSPCLGNLLVSLVKLIALKQYPQALVVIHRFLAAYNESNPYIRIEKWDPDHEPGTDYESCYEDSSTLDCVNCSDKRCPHAGDEDGCFESHDGSDCPTCERSDCRHYPEEEDEDADREDRIAGA